MDNETLFSADLRSIQGAPRYSRSDQESAAPLSRADLLIVTFVSSLWLWATVWALASAAFR